MLTQNQPKWTTILYEDNTNLCYHVIDTNTKAPLLSHSFTCRFFKGRWSVDEHISLKQEVYRTPKS